MPPPAPVVARLRGRLHQACAVAAVPAAVSVARLGHSPSARRAGAAYGTGLVAVFAVSAAYHRGRWGPRGKRFLKRLDHAAIYAFAATSYAPLGLVLPPGPRRLLRGTAWTAAGAGSAVKAVRLDADGGLADVLYLVTGWAGLLVLPTLVRSLTPAQRALLLGGGIVYTAGAAVLVRRRPDPAPAVFGYHELGHLVMLGGNPFVWAVCIHALDLGLRLLGTVRITGAEHVPRTGAALLAANHVSHLDPVVLLLVAHRCGRKVRIMGVQEVHEHPVVGRFVRAGRHIPVVQGSPSRAPLLAAEQALAAGELVLVYPEGTIPDPGARVAAKGGVGLLTSRAGVPVVPLRSRGLERGALTSWRPWRRLAATVSIGPPVVLPDVAHLRGSARYVALSDAVLTAVQRL